MNNSNNRNPFAYKRNRRPLPKWNGEKLEDALKELRAMKELQQKVELLEAERLAKVQSEERILKEKQEIENEQKTNEAIARLVKKAVDDTDATVMMTQVLNNMKVLEEKLELALTPETDPPKPKPWYRRWFW